MSRLLPTTPDPNSREWHDYIANSLSALADKAILRAGCGIGMTEIMPEDARLMLDAAKALAGIARPQTPEPLPEPATLSREGR